MMLGTAGRDRGRENPLALRDCGEGTTGEGRRQERATSSVQHRSTVLVSNPQAMAHTHTPHAHPGARSGQAGVGAEVGIVAPLPWLPPFPALPEPACNRGGGRRGPLALTSAVGGWSHLLSIVAHPCPAATLRPMSSIISLVLLS